MERVLTFDVLPGRLAICRLAPDAPLPEGIAALPFWSITRTPQELSIVLPEEAAPAGVPQLGGWRALMVEGPLDLAATGILARISRALAAAEVTLFAVSTYDTDYVLVREGDLERATAALRGAGCAVR